ncbi:MAG: acylphosphatase [Myxococcota bacterium]|nr:acylphosphatase [Myxococcota bacterium]
MSEPRARRRLVIHGRVQGVAFRDATVSAARRAGVAGWVRNRPDGTVEAVLEGPPDGVARVERFCSEGPPLARVERVDGTDEAPEGLAGFEVR